MVKNPTIDFGSGHALGWALHSVKSQLKIIFFWSVPLLVSLAFSLKGIKV